MELTQIVIVTLGQLIMHITGKLDKMHVRDHYKGNK
jgi:hypothetical protein